MRLEHRVQSLEQVVGVQDDGFCHCRPGKIDVCFESEYTGPTVCETCGKRVREIHLHWPEDMKGAEL